MEPETELIEIAAGGIELRTWPGAGGPPLVLLHEGLGSVGLWRDFPERLRGRTGRTVIAYSRFGHGASDPPPRPRTPSFFHEEALEVLPAILAAIAIEEPILLGHSDGASIALIHAASLPTRAVVLLAPHVFVEQVTIDAIRMTRTEFDDGDLRSRMARHHRDPDAAFAGWCDVWLDPEFRGWSLAAEIGRLEVPTLLLQGRDDPYGTFAQLTRIETGSPALVRRVPVAGGHSPHLEDEGAVLDAVEAFLADQRRTTTDF